MTSPFAPASPRTPSVFERAIARSRDGELTQDALLWVLAAGPVVVLDTAHSMPGTFPAAPLVLTRENQQFLAVFTHEDRAQMRQPRVDDFGDSGSRDAPPPAERGGHRGEPGRGARVRSLGGIDGAVPAILRESARLT